MLLRRYFFALVVSLSATVSVRATQDVITVTTSTTPGAPSTAEGYTFDNDQTSIDSFSTATDTYAASGSADNVFVRRNTVNSDQSSIWYTSSGVGTDLSGIHQTDYAALLKTNNILLGTDNTFANGTINSTGNIERIDFTWNSAITVNNSFAVAVFDRGAAGLHDSFAIAAVTAVDASGNPTAYGTLLKVAPGWGGATNAIGDFGYRLFRYGSGDDITAANTSTETGTQGIGGIVISAADLGLTNGQTIYGYSLMAADVTATNSNELLDWTNSTFFPTTTDGNTGGGGIDLVSLNGLIFAVVPETAPSALLLGAFGFFAALCNHLRKRRDTTR